MQESKKEPPAIKALLQGMENFSNQTISLNVKEIVLILKVDNAIDNTPSIPNNKPGNILNIPKNLLNLVLKVHCVDQEAAAYILKENVNLPGFIDSELLIECFAWLYTPQGHNYWKNIDNKIKSKELLQNNLK
jgi:hypothetical protein